MRSNYFGFFPSSRLPLMVKLLSFALILSFDSRAQLEFYHSNEINVTANGEILQLPWAGGLNNPQFSNIDLNFDGIQDLFIYDRTNKKNIMLLHSGVPNNTDYTLDFTYEAALPVMANWSLLRDFNCDGKVDIFTSRTSGFKVFKNTSTSGFPSFELHNGFVFSNVDLGEDPFQTNINISAVDIPAIDDIDNDGDLEIFTFSQGGSTVEMYFNYSMELFGNCDSLAYDLGNECYGMFSESAMNEDIYLGDEATCSFNVNNPVRGLENEGERSGLHSGSSICTVDVDQNGYKDLIIGDISGKTLSLVSIGPSSTNLDSAFALTVPYPVLDNSVDLEYFPTGYYVDVNNDGIKDLLSSPSNKNESEDVYCSYYYKNNGANDLLDLEYQQNDFLTDKMIDVGTGAYPQIVDYNDDGLMDLVISNKGYYQLGGDYVSQLSLYKNIGSETTPAFELITDDYLSLSTSGLGRFIYTTFGDLDNDGDADMVIGHESGDLVYYENTAEVGQELEFALGSAPILDSEGELIDIGTNSAPQLFDITEDGILDLIVGERNGNINLFTNIGSSDEYNFQLTNDTLGNIITDINSDFVGYGTPFVFDNGGLLEIIVGTQEGNLLHYNEISGNLDGDFNLITNNVLAAGGAERSSLTIYDFNNDNKLDMIVGNYSGGVDLWMGGTNVGIEESNLQQNDFNVYPNPANEYIKIAANKRFDKNTTITIFDSLGRIIQKNEILSQDEIKIDCSEWSNGIYHIQINQNKSITSKKVVITHN